MLDSNAASSTSTSTSSTSSAGRTAEGEQSHTPTARRHLQTAGWYWGSLKASEANEKLQEADEGTFLVRDSSHQDYFLTISVKTALGPTHLRIEYRDGKFRLDSMLPIKTKLQQFDSVVHLVEYYVALSRTLQNTQIPALHNSTVPLWLISPLYRHTPSLQHLCRLHINRVTKEIQALPLPNKLKNYLLEYKYQV
eukprot:gi/632980778/ref/XP_007907225.1/ PREDICTED: suppressor of cytokine signaling 2 [Callorhinchus milii]